MRVFWDNVGLLSILRQDVAGDCPRLIVGGGWGKRQQVPADAAWATTSRNEPTTIHQPFIFSLACLVSGYALRLLGLGGEYTMASRIYRTYARLFQLYSRAQAHEPRHVTPSSSQGFSINILTLKNMFLLLCSSY